VVFQTQNTNYRITEGHYVKRPTLVSLVRYIYFLLHSYIIAVCRVRRYYFAHNGHCTLRFDFIQFYGTLFGHCDDCLPAVRIRLKPRLPI
jgi:hypothetical protein